MVHHSSCPLCSSQNINPELRCTDHFVSGREFEIFICANCGFRFTQDYPEESEIGKYYESESYISHSDTSARFSDKLYRVARNFMLRRKRNLVSKVTGLKTGTILDIGSGTGYFASAMKDAGWISESVEINEKAREFARLNFGLATMQPDKIGSLEPCRYDCITLWHVLEHFHDPWTFISEIDRLLKPGASCIIALPNCNSYDAEHFGRFWAAWDVPRHLWHFSPGTFRSFSQKSGLQLMALNALPLDALYISQLSEKYSGSSAAFLKGMTLGSWFFLKSLFRKEKSSSLVYILKKPA